MAIIHDYDQLSVEYKKKLASCIENKNKNDSNQYYPDIHIKSSFYAKYGKRIIDILISLLALIVSFPINLIIGIITFFDVGMPIFFKQQRMGYKCKPFTMVKFRNMTNEKDENGILLRADQRVTKWGKFVRSASLDELLNFWNIFKGDMSLIGPRPLPLIYQGRFNQYHELRHSVRPGLDCPLRDPKKLMTWENRLENDSWYAQNVKFSTDIKLVLLLVKETLFGKDKAARSQGFSEGSFMGFFADGRVMDSNHIPEEYWEILDREQERSA